MGSRGSSLRAGGNAGSGAAALERARQEARAELSTLRAPSMGQTVSISYGSLEGSITRVPVGYARASGSNTMFAVNVTRDGENIFRTNRRGSNAFNSAKDDLRMHLGLD